MEHPCITNVTQSDCTRRNFSERERNSWNIAQNFERYVRDRRFVADSRKEDEMFLFLASITSLLIGTVLTLIHRIYLRPILTSCKIHFTPSHRISVRSILMVTSNPPLTVIKYLKVPF
jgi:hypothetical protein